MYSPFSEEHRMFQDAIKDFIKKEVQPLVKEAEEKEETPVQLFPKFGQLGYLCPAYPEEYGGGGLGKTGDCILIEELSRVCAGIAGAILVTSGLSTYPMLMHGTDEQKKEYLMRAIRGEKIGAFGLTEPNSGSDAAALETTAVRDGDHYIINGTKIYITAGCICDFVLVATTVDKNKKQRGISTIIVDSDTPGLTITKMKKLGKHSSSTAELVFDNCRVPISNLVGEEGKGFKYVLESLNGARITHAATSIGIAQAAFEASLDFAKQRIQFGQPIGHFQAIAVKLSNMATQIQAARTFMYQVAAQYDQGDECRKEGPMVKLFCSDMTIETTQQAMRIHAGAGYMADSDVQRYYRDAILATTTEGTSEIQQLIIAAELGLMA